MDIRTCIEESFYAVTYGRSYEVFGTNPRNPHQIRVKSDRGRKIWIPASYFADGEISVPMIENVIITDDLTDHQQSAIEVDLLLTSGEWRWCFLRRRQASCSLATPLMTAPRGSIMIRRI
ncbi:MAG TPA: hypothetical protein VD886_23645 [Herpetosiphonaceae bacterium]|nr:hypothetical protein [Herpetosiphonaceae bacterium]